VRILLEAGADESLQDHAGKTARDHAAAAGYPAVVDLLGAH